MAVARKPVEPTFSARMTVAEFLEWNDGDDEARYQLIDGEPRAMAPTTMTYGILQATVGRLVGNHFAAVGTRCHVVAAPGVQPRVRAKHNYRIPDLGVTCAPDQPGQRTVPDTILLIEILSPSNERDTWQNVWAYTSIPSVQEILVLHVAEIAAELLRRQADGNWPDQPERIEAGSTLLLESIGFRIAVADLYAGTHLAQSA
ncbi:MAG TPA: Uma2 family endonuclease [Azospirillum sp.]|nr:Uma2 family endonuclease [Azospirillum sp.]